jgi:hypothetical protein
MHIGCRAWWRVNKYVEWKASLFVRALMVMVCAVQSARLYHAVLCYVLLCWRQQVPVVARPQTGRCGRVDFVQGLPTLFCDRTNAPA